MKNQDLILKNLSIDNVWKAYIEHNSDAKSLTLDLMQRLRIINKNFKSLVVLLDTENEKANLKLQNRLYLVLSNIKDIQANINASEDMLKNDPSIVGQQRKNLELIHQLLVIKLHDYQCILTKLLCFLSTYEDCSYYVKQFRLNAASEDENFNLSSSLINVKTFVNAKQNQLELVSAVKRIAKASPTETAFVAVCKSLFPDFPQKNTTKDYLKLCELIEKICNAELTYYLTTATIVLNYHDGMSENDLPKNFFKENPDVLKDLKSLTQQFDRYIDKSKIREKTEDTIDAKQIAVSLTSAIHNKTDETHAVESTEKTVNITTNTFF